MDEMVIRLTRTDRVPLEPGQEILTQFRDSDGSTSSCRIQAVGIIGMGASCICYRVRAQFQAGIWRSCIMKEFYPDPVANGLEIYRDRQSGALWMDAEEQTLAGLHSRFYESGYRLQNDLSNLPVLTDVVVAPMLRLESADKSPWAAYILYEMNPGAVLGNDFLARSDAEGILLFACKLTESLSKLHAEKYLYMDLKPSNLLWTDQNNPHNSRVMFFDFDSAVNMQELLTLQQRDLRVSPALTAPELLSSQCFEQDKRFLMKPRLDLYSFGCTLYWVLLGRYPEEEDLPSDPMEWCRWEQEIHKLCDTGKLRGQIPAAAQNDLCFILKKCLCSQPRRRYASTELLHRDLSIVLKTIRLNADRPAAIQDINYEIPAAHLLYEHPLVEYVSGKELSVGLVGASPMRDELLKKLLACVQMRDVTTVIHIWDEDELEYLRALCRIWPELPNAADLYHGEVPMQPNSGKRLFSQPLARIYFHPWKRQSIPDITACSVFMLADAQGQDNYAMALRMEEQWERDRKGMICYADSRGDGFGLRSLTTVKSELKLIPFGMNQYYSGEELSLQSELLRRSFHVHKFYCGAPTDAGTIAQLWEDFQSDRYNIRSSNRFVLAIPYKLVGLGSSQNEQGAEFSGCLQEPKSQAQLLWLEHRSWCAFVLTEGYRCPSWDEVARYAYTGQNNQRNKLHKLHPCLCDSRISNLPMQTLTPEQWLTAPLEDFDSLDQVSLRMHRICQELTEKARQLLPMYLTILRQELIRSVTASDADAWLNTLEKAGRDLIADACESNRGWQIAFREVRAWWLDTQISNDTVETVLSLIEGLMRPVLDRNKYIDYKKYDSDVLRTIPDLLTADFERDLRLTGM